MSDWIDLSPPEMPPWWGNQSVDLSRNQSAVVVVSLPINDDPDLPVNDDPDQSFEREIGSPSSVLSASDGMLLGIGMTASFVIVVLVAVYVTRW